MSKKEVSLINYQKLLNSLEREKSYHLLLGNGFNNSLGVKTDYQTIFEKMQKEYRGYSQLAETFKKCGSDIEKLIGCLSEQVINNGSNKEFLQKYINNKIKHDFMKATSSIVRKKLKKIYQEKTQDIYLLMEKFTHYFTLNYDPLLYLLLMKFKKDEKKISVAFENNLNFFQKDLDTQNNDIYTKIKEACELGEIKTTVNNNSVDIKMSELNKKEFENAIKRHFKDMKWKEKERKQVTDKLWEEKQGNKKILEVNDQLLFEGIKEKQKESLSKKCQNLFFLHGAFHIYEKGEQTYKITQTENKPMYDKLWEIIQDGDRDIICILKDTDKLTEIKENPYLREGYKKLAKIKGDLVIIGCSLSENDNHIFRQINSNTNIKVIYYSSSEHHKENDNKKLKDLFSQKEIILFDRDTISYKPTK